jgi:hypothetical protein
MESEGHAELVRQANDALEEDVSVIEVAQDLSVDLTDAEPLVENVYQPSLVSMESVRAVVKLNA